ncbi:MAG: radical SAM family heme chaperone HemW [Tannerella sp.]|nr:radical SAM family heme chaperone HemW [Tannerella sp.]
MSGLYIHVPFCLTRCTYCDFYSQTQLIHKEEYIKAVLRELEMRKDYLEGDVIETVYWGGGTPSLLQPADFEQVFNLINRYYTISSSPEITLEANPDDMTDEYVAALRQLPFNRISMGVQSFHDAELRVLNRRHTAAQALRAIALCRQYGFSNLSIDLIYGLPDQSLIKWEENLDTAISLQLPHLSAYCLSYEEGTALSQQLQSGLLNPVEEDTIIQMFNILIDKLEASGYIHYEISNFSRPECYSRHNTSYWMDRKYIGIGPSAHSYDLESRQWNIASLPDYLEGIAKGIPNIEKEYTDERTGYNEYLMTRLRTGRGIGLTEFAEKFGQERLSVLLTEASPFLKDGMMENDDDRLRIARKGMMTADGLIRNLMEV